MSSTAVTPASDHASLRLPPIPRPRSLLGWLLAFVTRRKLGKPVLF